MPNTKYHYLFLALVALAIFGGVGYLANKNRTAINAPTSEQMTLRPTPTPKTFSYSGIVVLSGDKYFLIKNGKINEVQKGSFQLVKEVNQDTTSTSPYFSIDAQNKNLVAQDAVTSRTRSIGYKLKEEGNLYEQLGQILYGLNGKEAIIRIASFDKNKPESAFDGSRPIESVKEYRYDYLTNALSPTNIFDVAYNSIGEDKNPQYFGTHFDAWDSEKGLLYGINARFGEGEMGPYKLFMYLI